MVSSTRTSVRRVARCWASLPLLRAAPWPVPGTSRSTRPRRIRRWRGRAGRSGSRRSACCHFGFGRCRRLTIQRSAVREFDAAAHSSSAAVLAVAVHQHEARGVPQLVAEVAVALAALQVELDVAAGRGQAGEGEAQRIGAEGRDAVRELLARALLDRFAPASGSSGRWCAFSPARRCRCRRSGRSGRARCPWTCDIFWPSASRIRPCT